MSFIEVYISTEDSSISDILMAELGEIDFDTFEEVESGLKAYIAAESFDQKALDEIISRYKGSFDFTVEINSVEKENWNKKWEENYDPIEVDDRCIVKASFHNIEKKYPIEIIITPKMSFGTGHHATTWQMLKLQLDINFLNKKVLDVGCGTGVLAIMANKLGAKSIEATDIDEWCIENSKENYALNGINDVKIQKGEIAGLQFEDNFDIIIANINKNVLLKEIPYYSNLLVEKGFLLLSGFYEKDISDIKKCADKYNLILDKIVTKDNWAAVVFSKS
ncbi:50S ribosomal protein L11 methyltransferase [Reichenbachiella sp. MALMAid0571]|uniref:50S ribosomal protein L11 methyltransferase n=1 Tax=Reichenbachiella sp. MALMAid0571 TaxID=3143939 RepID=UPI0032DE678F